MSLTLWPVAHFPFQVVSCVCARVQAHRDVTRRPPASPVFTCLCLFLLSPPEVSVLRILMGIALFSSYKMYTYFWSQSPFWPEFNHVFCKVPIPVLFVVICHIPGATISFFNFDPFCIICFCCFSYAQSDGQH